MAFARYRIDHDPRRVDCGLRAGYGRRIALYGWRSGISAGKHTVNPTNPVASTALLVCGVYRLTRNPMYLGFALLLLALAVWLGKMSALLLVPLFMAYLQHFQIRPEEDALHARFGASFDTYCQQVRRWL